MHLDPRTMLRSLALVAVALAGAWTLASADTAQVNPWPADLSPAGLNAAHHTGRLDDVLYEASVAPEVFAAARNFVTESRARGLTTNSGRLSVQLGGANVRANDPTGDAIGETQSEVSVSVFGDTVVVGWNDSKGFTAGNTLSSTAYSTNGGLSFTDMGNVPLALSSDQAFGDTDLDTDGKGNWYLVSIYTRVAGAPDPTAEQNIAVWNGHFVAGALVWNTPVQAAVCPTTSSAGDKCYLCVDRAVTGNVYVGYTRFTTGNPNIEIVRSTDQGATFGAPVVLDSDAIPTASKQCANPYCGPNGEVYVVWEKGANLINCPDGSGNVASVNALIAFSKSTDFGATFSPYVQIGSPVTDFEAAGPGDLRERGNEFPDIVVDRSSCGTRGNIYVAWHSSAPWTANIAAGPVQAEAAEAANNNPGGAELFTVGENVTGTIASTTDLDYWAFDAVQGQSYLLVLDPQGFNCGVSGTSRGMRLRMYATQAVYAPATSFPDTLIAASAQGTFEDRITWTCPMTGRYLVRMSRSSGTTPFTYTLRVRTLTFGIGPDGARDTRDVVLTRSTDGGATWSTPLRLDDDPAGLENRRPFLAVDDNGRISAFWHDSRVPGFGSNAALTSVFGTTSRDGGLTWSPNYLVTDALSFFSFNTLAVPNLGDYNMASASGGTTIAGWSDQRVTAGEVRDPTTGTFTAGPGPDAWTQRISFAQSPQCPPPSVVAGGSPVTLVFCIQNTGTVPDQYIYVLNEPNGWLAGPPNGVTPIVPPGGNFCVPFNFVPPSDCRPNPSEPVSFVSQPVGSNACDALTCTTELRCEPAVPVLISDLAADDQGGGVVVVHWAAPLRVSAAGFNLYRGTSADLAVDRVNTALVPVTSSGEYSVTDANAPAGQVWYRLTEVQAGGGEATVATLQVHVSGLPTAFAFHLAGANPFGRAGGGTSFAYALPTASHVRVGVYNVAGQLVRSLVSADQPAGFYTLPLSLAGPGVALKAGAYLVRFDAGDFQRTVRVVALP